MVECRRCKADTRKRVVLKRKPLIDITDDIPQHSDVKKEFLCVNTIKSLRPNGRDSEGKIVRTWCEETCENHMLILNSK